MPTVPGGLFDDPTLSASQVALISRFLDLTTLSEFDLNVFNLRGQSSFIIDPDVNNHTIFNGADETLTAISASGDGEVIILAGDGRFVVTAGSDGDRILGGEKADTINGADGDDVVFGGDGSDSIDGSTGADLLYGNGGNDQLIGGVGSDTLFGGAGNDQLIGSNDADLLFGNRHNDVLSGNNGNDILYGNLDNDTIYGGEGADTIFGGQGNDVIYGEADNDVMLGNRGEDTFFIMNGSGIDRIIGYILGDDVIAVQANINGLVVTTENDLIGRIADDGSGNAVIDFSAGNTLTLVGFSADSLLANLDVAIDIV